MKKKDILLLMLPAAALLTGCIRDNYDDCPEEGQYICFVPKNNKHDYRDVVQNLDLYFYDQAGDLAAEQSYTRAQLRKSDYAAPIPQMAEGKYTVVATVNHRGVFEIYEKERYETVHSTLKEEEASIVDGLFFTGTTWFDATNGHGTQEHIMDIVKQNSNIDLTVVMDGYTPPRGSTFDAYILGCNGMYHHADMYPSVMHEYRRKYLSQHIGENHFRLGTLLLWKEADVELVLEQNGAARSPEKSVRIDLIEELAKVKNDKGEYLYNTTRALEYNDEYDIELTLGADFVVLSLTINGWSVIGDNVEV